MAADKNQGRVLKLAIDSIIIVKKFNARGEPSEDDKDFKELKASIKEAGLHQPVLAWEKEPGKYQLVAGFRRYYACQAIGYATIDANLMPPGTTELDALYANLQENVDRKNLSAYELANRCALMKAEHKETDAQIAGRLHKSRGHVSNLIRCIEKLPSKIIDAWKKSGQASGFEAGAVSSGGGFTLQELFKVAGMKSEKEMIEWFDTLVRKGGKDDKGEKGEGEGTGARNGGTQKPLNAKKMMALVKALEHDTDHSKDFVEGARAALRFAAADLKRNPFAAAVRAMEEAQAVEEEETEEEETEAAE